MQVRFLPLAPKSCCLRRQLAREKRQKCPAATFLAFLFAADCNGNGRKIQMAGSGASIFARGILPMAVIGGLMWMAHAARMEGCHSRRPPFRVEFRRDRFPFSIGSQQQAQIKEDT